MPKIFVKFCCCFRPQRCKKVEHENEQSTANGNSVPTLPASSPPISIITQINKDNVQPHSQIVRRSINAPDSNSLNNNAVIRSSDSSNTSSPYNKNKYQEVRALLPPPHPMDHKKKCLIVDLDETLVHSSFKPVKDADFVIPVEIDNVVHQVHVLKRPHADEFLARIGELFECVLFTASLDMYADPVADLLDRNGVFRSRLFREACVFFDGNYVKDLTRLGRDLSQTLIIDNSPISYAFHPENAIAVRTWFDDPHDSELLDLFPLLEQLAHTDDIYSVLRKSFMSGNFAGNYE